MIDANDKNSQVGFIVFIVLGVVAFFANVININYKVKNSKLETKIEQLEDEKANLRARYLSEIALDKLNSRAGQLDMRHVSQQGAHKVSKKIEKLRVKKLKKQIKQVTSNKPLLVVSGY